MHRFEESEPIFLEAVRRERKLSRTLPGLVKGFVFEKTDGKSNNIVTPPA